MSLNRQGTRSGFFLISFFVLLGLLCPAPEVIGGQQQPNSDDAQADAGRLSPGHLLLELGWGWHTVSDSRYQEVYSKGNGMIFFAVHPFFKSLGRHSFGFSAGIKSFSKTGESTVTREETQLTLIPIYLGGEYTLNLEPFFPGIEIGVDHCLYREQSSLMITKGSTTGYHIQGNLVFQPPGLTFLRMKLYIRHSGLPADEAVEVNLGGLEYGAALLIKLNFSGSKK